MYRTYAPVSVQSAMLNTLRRF